MLSSGLSEILIAYEINGSSTAIWCTIANGCTNNSLLVLVAYYVANVSCEKVMKRTKLLNKW